MAKNILARFEYDKFYHVFNRTNNKETLFRSNANKKYFLELCRLRLKGYIEIYAMALLGNHFHLAIKIKSQDEILQHLSSLKQKDMSLTEKAFLTNTVIQRDVHMLISRQFGRIFNSYSQAFNKKYRRDGHLFHAPFKRSAIISEANLLDKILYVHLNSTNHGLVKDFKMDKWHSYRSVVNNDTECLFHNLVEAKATLALFQSRKQFILSHNEMLSQCTKENIEIAGVTQNRRSKLA